METYLEQNLIKLARTKQAFGSGGGDWWTKPSKPKAYNPSPGSKVEPKDMPKGGVGSGSGVLPGHGQNAELEAEMAALEHAPPSDAPGQPGALTDQFVRARDEVLPTDRPPAGGEVIEALAGTPEGSGLDGVDPGWLQKIQDLIGMQGGQDFWRKDNPYAYGAAGLGGLGAAGLAYGMMGNDDEEEEEEEEYA